MLRLQRKRGTKDAVKERSQQACQFQPQGKSKGYAHWKDKTKLKVTYPPLSGKCKMRSCLSLTATCPAGRSSFYRWSRSGRLGLVGRLRLAGRLKFDRTFLVWREDIYDFNLLLPTWRITIPSPSGGMREKPRLPTNSCSNEVIMAYQYPCIAGVQRPSLSEPGIVTALKCCL